MLQLLYIIVDNAGVVAHERVFICILDVPYDRCQPGFADGAVSEVVRGRAHEETEEEEGTTPQGWMRRSALQRV